MPDRPRLRSGGKSYVSEAELAELARRAVGRRRNAEGEPVTQTQAADVFGVRQTDVSNALRYDPDPDHLSRRPAAALLRRRILAAWGGNDARRVIPAGGLRGPYWLPTDDPDDRAAAVPDPHLGDGYDLPADDPTR